MHENRFPLSEAVPLRLAQQAVKRALLPLRHHSEIRRQRSDKGGAVLAGIGGHQQVYAILG